MQITRNLILTYSFFVDMESHRDEELEKIKRKKLEEMMDKISGSTEKTEETNQPTGKPIDLNDATFNQFVKDNSLAVIDCWAPWCGPCRIVSPVVEALAKDYAGKIAFGKLNVDQNNMVARQYRIMSIPTLLVFKMGKLVDQIIGAMPRQMLEPKIIKHL
jgi:thioredoxin 1